MNPFSVVVAGGGVAAVEGLLRIRRLLGESVKVTLLAPNDDFAVRALSVNEPFARGGSARHLIRHIARDADARWVKDKLAWVDVERQVAHAGDGRQFPYDALLVAVGARMVPAFDHVTTFHDAEADALFGGIVQDIEAGYTKSVAFIMPPGPVWQLPLYELALMTAERASSMGMDDVELTVVTPDEAPLAIFGPPVSDAVAGLLAEAGVAVETATVARVPGTGRVALNRRSPELHVNRIVALPQFTGPAIRGLPGGRSDGFIPFDAHCTVPGTGGHVFAAGDATRFPVKHGGLGAEQADTAANAIAYLAGIDVPDERFRPVIRGKLLTGNAPLYMKARLAGSGCFESEVSNEPLWPSGEKVAAEELSQYRGRQRPSS